MTRLPAPEQWVLCTMSEMETAEMIEQHIEHYAVDEGGNSYPVHYPTPFVKHYMKRDDNALPIIVAIATAPLVLGHGELLAPDGFDRLRGIQFIIKDKLRAIIPKREDCTPDAVKEAMEFLCDDWLCDVKTDAAGKCTVIGAALTMIERSLLDQRPCFFVTAGRRGGGKTMLLTMLIMAVTGIMPAAAAWSSNEEERRKALLAYFLAGVPYILWDNIPRGTQISCPHIEKSCTAAYYADRKLGVSEAVCTAAATIHLFNGNNVGPKGDLASRSQNIRIDVDRADPENREFKHPDPVGWTENHRVEIMAAFYTILLGNPQLKESRDAPGRTRFKLWWRLVGSAVENAAKQTGKELDFQKMFVDQEKDDEESTSLADMLEILWKQWQDRKFTARAVAGMINDRNRHDDGQTLREFLLPGADFGHVFSAKSIGRLLNKHVDGPVRSGERTLVLRSEADTNSNSRVYKVETIGTT
jgi:hypothetical protein